MIFSKWQVWHIACIVKGKRKAKGKRKNVNKNKKNLLTSKRKMPIYDLQGNIATT